jgi:hypothetical protein
MTDTREKSEEVGQQGINTSFDDTVDSHPEKEWAPIRTQDSRRNSLTPASRSNSRPTSFRSMSRVRSQNGYGCDDQDDESDQVGDAEGQPEKDPFEVGWDDGDKDPLNPRSKSKFAKWAIVIICSMSSLCV